MSVLAGFGYCLLGSVLGVVSVVACCPPKGDGSVFTGRSCCLYYDGVSIVAGCCCCLY